MTTVASGFQPNFIISSGDNFYESEQDTQAPGHQGSRGAGQLVRICILAGCADGLRSSPTSQIMTATIGLRTA